jgi:integrase
MNNPPQPTRARKRRNGNGQGSVFWSRAKRRYVGRVHLRGGQQPQRKEVYGPPGDRSGAAKLIVIDELARYREPQRAVDALAPSRCFFDEWATRPTLSANSRSFYRQLVANHLDALGRIPLIDVRPTDVRDAVNALATKPRTARAAYAFLKACFAEAVRMELLRSSPVTLKPPKYVREEKRRSFTPEEVDFLLDAANGDPLEAMLVLSLNAPFRPCELFGLRPCDLDLAHSTLTVSHDLIASAESGYKPVLGPTKTSSSRRNVRLGPVTVALLREHLKRNFGSEYLFTSPGGAPLRLSNAIRRWWRPLLRKAAAAAQQAARAAGDETYRFPSALGLNALRHTSFELQPLAGIDYDVASERGGHSSPRTTYRNYREIAEQRHREAAEQIDSFIARRRRALSDAVGGRVGGSRPHPKPTATAEENEKPLIDKGFSNFSGCWTRTNDPLINSQLLYQLS